MTGILVKGEEPHFGVTPRKEGLYYDDCPNPSCGKRDIEPAHRLGDSADGNHGTPDGVIYYCDPREGGSGDSWTRARGSVADDRAKKGLSTKNLTGDAMRGAYVSVPSDAFRNNYERAFGHE